MTKHLTNSHTSLKSYLLQSIPTLDNPSKISRHFSTGLREFPNALNLWPIQISKRFPLICMKNSYHKHTPTHPSPTKGYSSLTNFQQCISPNSTQQEAGYCIQLCKVKIETVEFRCLQEWRISTKSSLYMKAGPWSCFSSQWKAVIKLNAAAWSLRGWEPQQHVASRDQKIRKNTGSTTKLEAMSEAWDLGKMAQRLKQLSAQWAEGAPKAIKHPFLKMPRIVQFLIILGTFSLASDSLLNSLSFMHSLSFFSERTVFLV